MGVAHRLEEEWYVLRKTETNPSHPIHPTNHSSAKEDAIRNQALKGCNILAMGGAHRLKGLSP